MDHNNLSNTLQHLFRTLVPTPAQNQRQRSNNNENAGGQSTSAAPDTTTGTSQTVDAAASSPHTTTPGHNLGDVEMSAVDHSNINDDDDEMPELQSVSDSDSEDEDLNEVEMQAHYDGQTDLNALVNGGGGDRLMSGSQTRRRHPQSHLSANPASSSTPSLPRPNRRARVEDDHDEDRDRRHPSERVNAPRVEVRTPMYSTHAPGATQANPTPTPLNAAPPPQSQPQPQQPRGPTMFPDLMNMFLQEFRRRTEQRQNQGQQNAQAPPAPQPPTQNPQEAEVPPTNVFGEEGGPQTTGFAITFDLVNGGEPVVTAATGPPWAAMGVPGGNAAPGGNGANGRGPPGSRSNPIALDADALFTFINMLGVIPGAFGGPEVEDPERAKQLVDALEEVPIGLIRRMERVSEGVDLSGTGGEVNCSICWDRLLDSEGGSGWAKKDEEHDHSHTESEQASGEGSSSSGPAPTTSDDAPASSTEAGPSSTESTEDKQPKIVSLPCAHVFHAACLIPWFSRPRQTTCPACRFNIDPENLTYRPQARRRTADATTTPATTANAAAQTGTNAEQQPPAPAATAAAGVQTPDAAGPAPPRAGRENVEQTVETLESLRDALTRRIDQAEAEERDLVARIMRNAAEASDLEDDIEVTQFEIHQDGSNAAPTPATPPPVTPAETPAAANPADPFNANRPPRTTSILTIGVDVIIGTVGPNMDDLPMDDIDHDQQPNQEQPQPQGQGPNMRRFGAPFGAGLRTGNTGNRQWVGSGRTFNEAFASLFANNNNLGGGPGNATAAPANPPPAAIPIPVVFGPPPPIPASQVPPAPGARQPSNPSNNGRNGPTTENFNLGQIFNRLFGGIGGQREAQGQGQGQGTPTPAQQPRAQAQTQTQGPPTQLPPFLNVNAGPAPSPATQPTPTAGPTNNNTNLPPLQQHFANIFGGVPGFPPGGAGTAPRMPPGGPPNAAPRVNRERKKWTLPPPPGPTLRQRIEKAEREVGLRCFDVSCGVGPSDEEPFTTLDEAAKKQLSIQDADDKHDGTPHHDVCTHTFHPSCLVSAARVALMGEDATLIDDGKRVEVSCSVCRCEGSVLKNDWDEGVDALA